MNHSEQLPSDQITSVSQLREIVGQFVAERDWRRFHNLKNLSMAIAIEAAELMEHTQWLTTQQVESGEPHNLHGVAEELVDVLCYVLALANRLDIDLTGSLLAKMDKTRRKYPVDSPQTAMGLPTPEQ
jgi:dCTP diphosphatase